MRPRFSAAALAASLALTLAACSSDDSTESPSASASASEAAPTEAPTEAPEVVESDEGMPTLGEGDDDNPVLEFPDGDAPSGLQISVIEEGKGEEITPDSLVVADYVGQVWGNDEPFDSSFVNGSPLQIPLSQLVTGWGYTLSGHHVGGKYIISLPADYGYGPTGGNDSAGIGADDTIAFYVEIEDGWSSASTGEADAKVVTPAEDLPVAIEGEPGEPVTSVSVNEGESEPKELGATVIAEGTGDKVPGDGSTVFINYAATSWDGELSENSWTGEPEELAGAQPVVIGSGTVFDELKDVPVGSRVLLIIPESDGGEEDVSSPAMAAVVDVLGFGEAAS